MYACTYSFANSVMVDVRRFTRGQFILQIELTLLLSGSVGVDVGCGRGALSTYTLRYCIAMPLKIHMIWALLLILHTKARSNQEFAT